MRSIAAAMISLGVAAVAFSAAAQSPRTGAAPGENNSGASGRIERLEEQVADLRGVVSAVETLAKSNSGGASGYTAAGGGASSEQIRQLSEQIADLQQRLERLESRAGQAAGPAVSQQANASVPQPRGFEDKEQLPPLTNPASPDRLPPRQQPRNGGADPSAPPPFVPRSNPGPASASASGPARTLFDQAYGALNRREYSAAETYFQQFLEQYPADPQAGSAQYWLGETAFVSGEYRSAADRFLKTFTNYPTNERAPEALLKLAISLRRLGENTAACDSFAELERRFPQAPRTVLQRAESEKKRANCT